MARQHGFLPYGTQDSSILLQHPLTSDPSAYFATKGTHALVGSGHTYHATSGFAPSGTRAHHILNMTDFATLSNSGQISYQLSRSWICEDRAAFFSTGYSPAASETAVSYRSNSLGTKTVTTSAFSATAAAAGADLSTTISSCGKDDFVTVNIGWNGSSNQGKSWMAINGCVVAEATRNQASFASVFDNFYIGCLNGASQFMAAGYYIRNLQVSNRAPMLLTNPRVHNIAMLSDSLLLNDDLTTPYSRDATSSWSMRRRLAEFEMRPGVVNVSVNNGYCISDDPGAGTYLRNSLPALLASRPSVLVLRAGTNDAAQGVCSNANWQAKITDYINDSFATTHMKVVILLGIPTSRYSTGPVPSQITTGNQKLSAAAVAWRAANPNDPRQVLYADVYNHLGGEYPQPGTFIGQINGLNNDLHFGGQGHLLHGRFIADKIVEGIGLLS